MRERIRIERLSDSAQSSSGEPANAWIELCTVWARSRPISGSVETLEGERVMQRQFREFTARLRKDVTEKMRIVWDGQEWNIHSVEPDEERRFMILTTSRTR